MGIGMQPGFRAAWLALVIGLAGCQSAPPPEVELVTPVGGRGVPSAPAEPAVQEARGLGRPDAPVAIVEYSDYQCPVCRRFHLEVLPRLRARYIDTGQVQWFFRDLPLSMHREALPAALAARCAADQGKFWPMNEALFARQAQLGAALYPQLAQQLALDGGRFNTCMASPDTRRRVQRDAREAQQFGITGTPGFLLGRYDGERLEVARSATGFADYETFAREIEQLLAGPRR